MKNNITVNALKIPLSLRMIFFAEVIVALRVLFFTVPVMISGSTQDKSPADIDDRFILILTLICALYLMVGIISMLGHRLWRFFHYLASGVVLMLTAAFIQFVVGMKGEVSFFYLLPIIVSAVILLCVSFIPRSRSLI